MAHGQIYSKDGLYLVMIEKNIIKKKKKIKTRILSGDYVNIL
jgi:hypothetical protein